MSSPIEQGRDERHWHTPRVARGQTGAHESQIPQSAALADAERGLTVLLAVLGRLRAWESFESDGSGLLRDLVVPLGLDAGVLWLPQKDALVARVIWTVPSIEHAALADALRPVRFPRGVGLPGCAWLRRELIHEGMSIADDASRQQHAHPCGLHAALALPALAAGEVLGVLELYSTSPVELSERVRQVLTVLGTEVGCFFARRRGELELSPLSARELEVLTLTTLGLANREVGERLAISHATVKTHLEHIYRKFGVSDRAAAVAYALRAGFIA